MSTAANIRLARSEDAAEIARLTIELGYSASQAQSAQRLELLLQSPHHAVFVATTTRTTTAPDLIGWAATEQRILLELGQKAELTGLVVDPCARGLGVGRALVLAVEKWAAERHLDTLCVRSNTIRSGSHPFYLQLGYSRIKTQHVYEKNLLPH